MADVEQHIAAVLTVNDRASGPLNRIVAAAEGLNSRFEGVSHALTSMIPLAGGVATALSFHGVMQTTESYIKQLKAVRELTGASAAETDYLFSSARKAGIEYGQMQNIMFSLSRRASAMTEQMQAMGGRVTGTAKRMQQMGVDMTKGPVHAMMTLSQAVKKGRVGAEQLMSQFRIPMGAVNDFKGFLEQLDENQLKKALESGQFITEEDIKAMADMESAQNRIADAYNRIQVMLGKSLLPVIADLTDKVAKKIEDWLPAAQKFGRYLADNFDKLLATAKLIMATFAAKKVFNVAMATPMLGTALSKLGAEISTRFMGSLAMAMAGGAGPLSAVMSTLSMGFSTLAGTLLPIVGIVALVAAGLYAMYKAFDANIGGIKDYFVDLVGRIGARFSLLFEMFGKLWDWLTELGTGSSMSKFLEALGTVLWVTSGLGPALALVGETLDFMLHVALTAGGYLSDVWYMVEEDVHKAGDAVGAFFESIGKWLVDLYNKAASLLPGFNKLDTSIGAMLGEGLTALGMGGTVDVWTRNWERTQRETERRAAERAAKAVGRGEGDREKARGPTYDFRGSRFDITQNFAEGFDPDRIAVAFASDLGSLAETKAQSGFAPLYAVR